SLFQAHKFKKKSRLDRIRDLFVLQCHTGLRVSDLKRINKAHIKGDVLEIRAFKNNEEISLDINPTIEAILKKYDYQIDTQLKISDQKYNDGIKAVAKAVIPDTEIEVWQYVKGVKKPDTVLKYTELSSHCAVR